MRILGARAYSASLVSTSCASCGRARHSRQYRRSGWAAPRTAAAGPTAGGSRELASWPAAGRSSPRRWLACRGTGPSAAELQGSRGAAAARPPNGPPRPPGPLPGWAGCPPPTHPVEGGVQRAAEAGVGEGAGAERVPERGARPGVGRPPRHVPHGPRPALGHGPRPARLGKGVQSAVSVFLLFGLLATFQGGCPEVDRRRCGRMVVVVPAGPGWSGKGSPAESPGMARGPGVRPRRGRRQGPPDAESDRPNRTCPLSVGG